MIDYDERDLREALRPLRPEPQAFRRAVERKLAERREQDVSQPAAGTWRSAAALLPLGVFGPASSGSALALGPAPAVQGLAALLSLPALTLAMLAWTAAAGARALTGLRASASATRQAAERAAREWWREHLLHALASLALLSGLAWTQPAEAVLFVLLVSMLALVGVLQRLSRAGAVSRESVGTLTANLLGGLAAIALLASSLANAVDTPTWADPWVPWTVLLGALSCSLIGSWSRSWSPSKKLASVLALALVFGWSGARMHAGLRSIDRARLVDYVEGFDAPIEDVVEWQRLGVVAGWLRADGVDSCGAPSARAELERALAELQPGESVLHATAPAHSLLGAARGGLLPEAHWELLRADARYAQRLGSDGPLLESAVNEWVLRAAARAPLQAAQRERIAARLMAAWPEPEAARALEALAFYDEMWDLVVRAPLDATTVMGDESPGDTVRRALASHWSGSGPSAGAAASFATDPRRVHEREADVRRGAPTRAAVRLMRRFGVPAGVSLDAVEGFLGRAATPSLIEVLMPGGIEHLSVQSHRFVAEVALRELQALRDERDLERPPAGALRRLSDLRPLLGALALVVLCLFANLRVAMLGRGRT